MIETVLFTFFSFSFLGALEEWLRKKRETHFLVLCGAVPAVLHLVGVSIPISVAIAILLAIAPLVTAWRRDRPYGQKLLKFSLPLMGGYIILALLLLYL
jgi:Flp pilus assembly protein TadB